MAETTLETPSAEMITPQETYHRFSPAERFEHMILAVVFIGLGLTGLPQRYAGNEWAQTLINALGGIESIRIVHRILATILMAESIYHGGILTYKIFVLGRRATLMVGFRDLRDLLQWIAFNLGIHQSHPHLPRYNFGEKAEYLAVVWGTLVMVGTGFMLWNPIATTSVLPGEVVPAALAAHSGEALLAVLSILTWHMYNVLFKRFNRSIFTGRLEHDAMEEEHAEELGNILQGHVTQDPPPEVINRRMRYFIPYAFVTASLLIIGLIWFVTLENTAITTIDPIPVDEEIKELTISAEMGDAETGLTVWESQDCAECHGENAEGTPGTLNIGIANTTLTFEEFVEKVRRGPADMTAYSPRKISDEDLAHIYTWLQSLGE